MDQLTGMALNLSWMQEWDHTYVASSSGKSWGCFGRDTGGRTLDQGMGNDPTASCLALSDGSAGIKYGLTGVCQQASNRILYQTGVTVAQAGGYGISLMLFGQYGRGSWLARDYCLKNARKTQKLSNLRMDELEEIDLEDEGHIVSSFIDHVREMTGKLDEVEEHLLRNVQRDLLKDQGDLARQVGEGRVTGDEYLKEVQQLLVVTIERTRDILGGPRTALVFGAAAQRPEGLIDRDTFLHTRSR